jgi:hypothetical protein
LANRNLIAPPINKRILLYANGNTNDIINSVMWADTQPEHKASLKDFAPGLKGSNEAQTCFNVWDWTKKNIKYILDPPGKQFVKSPSQTMADGFADCKSRSVFMASCLKNLGIPYAYRFASYSGSFPVRHVYIIAKPKGSKGWYAMDPDMPSFNKQQQTTYFIDKDMSEISYVAGAGNPDTVGKKSAHFNLSPEQKAKLKAHRLATPDMILHRPVMDMTHTDMEIALRRHRHAINKHILDAKKGIGSAHSEVHKDLEDVYSDAAHIMALPDLPDEEKIAGVALAMHDYRTGQYDSSVSLAGIGDIGKKNQARKAAAAPRRSKLKERAQKTGKKLKAKAEKGKGKAKGLFKKLGAGLKKVVKGAAHLAKSIANAPLKILLNVTLPKAADFFIYLFIKKPDIIAKLPAQARAKRKTSEAIALFIIHAIGMKDDHFMGLIRNGIMKKHHKSPERVLSESLHMNISGIGDLEEIGIIDDIVKVVFSVIKQIAKLFKKKIPAEAEGLENDSTAAAPNIAEDFAGADASVRTSLAQAITQQPISPEEKAASDPNFVQPAASGSEGAASSPTPHGEEKETDHDTAAAEEVLKDPTPTNSRKAKAC